MSIELYWGSGSGPAWRVMLALAHKGVPYTGHLLSFSARDTRKPEFLAKNPRGKVPVIVEGDFVLNESLAILAWLEARFPERPLFGPDPARVGQVWRHIMEYETHGKATVDAISRPIFTQGAEGSTLVEPVAAAEAELDLLASRVKDGFLVGDSLSAADLVWYIGLRTLERAATRPKGLSTGLAPLGARWSALLPWARNVEAIPGFADTLPPHWREGDNPSATQLG